jgi:hypothetical protein
LKAGRPGVEASKNAVMAARVSDFAADARTNVPDFSKLARAV